MAGLESFRGLHALVTGASSGIGRSLALRLAREGARVSLVARRREALEALAGEIHAAGGKARVLPCDVADREAAEARRASPVEPAQSSPDAQSKAAGKRTPEGLPVQSLKTLLEHLKALTLNQVTLPGGEDSEFPLVSQASSLQARALELLGVDPQKIVSSGKPT